MIRPPQLAASSLVIIWFANDRRLVVAVLVLFIFFVLVIVVVGIPRRHRVEDDGDDAPVDQTGSKILGDVQGHVGSCWMSRHSQVNAIRVAVKNKLHPLPTQSRFGFPLRHAAALSVPLRIFFSMRSQSIGSAAVAAPRGAWTCDLSIGVAASIPGTFCLKPNVIERQPAWSVLGADPLAVPALPPSPRRSRQRRFEGSTLSSKKLRWIRKRTNPCALLGLAAPVADRASPEPPSRTIAGPYHRTVGPQDRPFHIGGNG